MNDLAGAIVGAIGTLFVAIISYFTAKRVGIGPFQDTLVSTLKSLVEAQEKEITTVKNENTSLRAEIDGLKKRVDDLETLTINQARLIDSLTNTSTAPIRKRVPPRQA